MDENSGNSILLALLKGVFSIDAVAKLLIAVAISCISFIPIGIYYGIKSSIALAVITLLALAAFDALRKNNTLAPYAVFIILLLPFMLFGKQTSFRRTELFSFLLFTLTDVPLFIAGSEANRITKAKGKPFFAVVLLVFIATLTLTAANDFFIRVMKGTGPMPAFLFYVEDFVDIAVFLFFVLFMYSPYFVTKEKFLSGFLKSAVFSARHFAYSLLISLIPALLSLTYILLLRGWNRYAVSIGDNNSLAFQVRISGITDVVVFTVLLLFIFDGAILRAHSG